MSSQKDPAIVALEAELHLDLLRINTEELPLDTLLEETRQELQTVRALLPQYRTLQNTKDWAAHVKETDDRYKLAQERYAELKADTAGVFERNDYHDALFDALSLRKTMDMIIRRAESKPRQAGGCLVFAALLIPAAAGITWRMI